MNYLRDRYSLSAVLRNAEAGTGGAAGAGQGGAGAGAAAASGAGASAGAAAGAGQGAAGAAGAGSGADPWYKPFNLDQSNVEYLTAKGINDPAGIIKVAQDFEKAARERNAIAKPADLAKLNEWDGWKELGWTEDAAKYAEGFKKPEVKQGQVFNEELFSAAQKAAHEIRMPAGMAATFYERMYNYMQEKAAGFEQAQRETTENNRKALDTDLRKEWGADFDKKSELSKRAAVALGIAPEASAELENIVKSPSLVRMFATIGEKLGEDTLAGINQGGNAKTTPEQAAVELRRLEADKDFISVLNNQRDPRHEEFVSKRLRLIELAAPVLRR